MMINDIIRLLGIANARGLQSWSNLGICCCKHYITGYPNDGFTLSTGSVMVVAP